MAVRHGFTLQRGAKVGFGLRLEDERGSAGGGDASCLGNCTLAAAQDAGAWGFVAGTGARQALLHGLWLVVGSRHDYLLLAEPGALDALQIRVLGYYQSLVASSDVGGRPRTLPLGAAFGGGGGGAALAVAFVLLSVALLFTAAGERFLFRSGARARAPPFRLWAGLCCDPCSGHAS
jgi:hypothetical protein